MVGIYLPERSLTTRDWLGSIDARNQEQAKYNKNNTVGFYMKLNTHADADIIYWLQSQPSKQGAIKRLTCDEITHRASEKRAGRAEPLSEEPWNTGARQSRVRICRESPLT